MNLSELSRKFNTQNKCIKHLEKVRWDNVPICPYCGKSDKISAKPTEFRYLCHSCGNSFSVLVGTIFENTNLPLPVWFQMITLMINTRVGVSSKELALQLGITQKTAWFNAMKIRCAMLEQARFLEGIIEMDEAYIGGKPRKLSKEDYNKPLLYQVDEAKNKRGRGTSKIPVVGIVQRGGKQVATKIIEKLSTRNLLAMLKQYVSTDGAVLITDEFSSYKKFDEHIEHLTINHKKEFSRGIIHTNTIENFWSILKGGIQGSYNAVSKKYLPFYLAEFSYRYSRSGKNFDMFSDTVKKAVKDKKCMVKYKPTKENTKKLAYPRVKAKVKR